MLLRALKFSCLLAIVFSFIDFLYFCTSCLLAINILRRCLLYIPETSYPNFSTVFSVVVFCLWALFKFVSSLVSSDVVRTRRKIYFSFGRTWWAPGMNYVNVLIVFNKCQLSLLFTGDFTLETLYLFGRKDAFNLPCATAFMKTGQTRLLAVFVLFYSCYFYSTEWSWITLFSYYF